MRRKRLSNARVIAWEAIEERGFTMSGDAPLALGAHAHLRLLGRGGVELGQAVLCPLALPPPSVTPSGSIEVSRIVPTRRIRMDHGSLDLASRQMRVTVMCLNINGRSVTVTSSV
jgi:hypothetical protein